MKLLIYAIAWCLLLLLTSCDERITQSRKTVLTGSGEYEVSYARDVGDSIILVGQTYDIGISGFLSDVFSLRLLSNLALYSPLTGRVQNFPPANGKIGCQIAYDSTNGDLFCTSSDGRIARYDFIGRRWEDIPNSLPPDVMKSLTLQSSGGILYLMAGVSNAERGVNFLQYVSRDKGKNWQARLDVTIAGIDPFNPCRLISYKLKSMSSDCGFTWTELANAPLGASAGAAIPDPRNINVIFSAADSGNSAGPVGLIISKDWGQTWKELSNAPRGAISLSPDPKTKNGLFLIDQLAIWGSNDLGATWSRLNTLPDSSQFVAGRLIPDYRSGCVYLQSFPLFPYSVYFTCDGFKSLELAYTGGSAVQPVPLQDGTLLFTRVSTPAQYLAKFTSSGTPLFSTYLSGSDPVTIRGVHIAPNGEIIVNGWTDVPDYPKTYSLGTNEHSFILRISNDGRQLLSSTRLPGSAEVTVGPDGGIWAFGASNERGPYVFIDGTYLVPGSNYLVKLSQDGARVLYGTGLSADTPQGLIVDADDNAYLASAVLPTRGFDVTSGYVTKIDTRNKKIVRWPNLSQLNAGSMQILANGDLLIAGANGSSSGAAISSLGAFQSKPTPHLPMGNSLVLVPYQEAYLLRLRPDGTVRFATYMGGENDDWMTGALYGKYGQVTAVGNTKSISFPTKGLLETRQNFQTGFLAKFDPGFTSLLYSTYLNRFSPAGIFPHPEGGSLIVGSGLADPNVDGPDGIVFIRVKEEPGQLPRIDSVLPAGAKTSTILPGDQVAIKGDGFSSNSNVLLGTMVIPSTLVSATELRANVPASATFGPATVRVETNGQQSQIVSIRIGN